MNNQNFPFHKIGNTHKVAAENTKKLQKEELKVASLVLKAEEDALNRKAEELQDFLKLQL